MQCTKSMVEAARVKYPRGTRVRLVDMDDIQAPPPGTLGTVQGVDDMADIMIAWDNGSHLSAIYGLDLIEKI